MNKAEAARFKGNEDTTTTKNTEYPLYTEDWCRIFTIEELYESHDDLPDGCLRNCLKCHLGDDPCEPFDKAMGQMLEEHKYLCDGEETCTKCSFDLHTGCPVPNGVQIEWQSQHKSREF